MTREQFIASHYHELVGLVLDAAMHRRDGAELSLWLRSVVNGKAVAILGKVYDAAQLTPANGQPQPVRKA